MPAMNDPILWDVAVRKWMGRFVSVYSSLYHSISAMSIFLRCKHLTQNRQHFCEETLGSPRCADHWFLGDGPSEHVLGEFERCST